MRVSPGDENALFMCAVCLHATGQMRESLARYDQLFKSNPEHLGYCQWDIAVVQTYVTAGRPLRVRGRSTRLCYACSRVSASRGLAHF